MHQFVTFIHGLLIVSLRVVYLPWSCLFLKALLCGDSDVELF